MFRNIVLLLASYALFFVVTRVLKGRTKQKILRNFPGPPSESFVTGVIKSLHSPFAISYRERVLVSYGRVIKLPAMFGGIQLAVSDPQAVAALFGRYRDQFDIGQAVSETFNTIFGPSIVASRDGEHNKHRKLLNPVFSPRVLRETVPLMHSVAKELVDNLLYEVGHEFADVELSGHISRFSLETVSRTMLGYSFGPLADHGTDYSRALKMFGAPLAQLAVWRPLLPWLRRTFPAWLLRLAVRVLPWKALRQMRFVCETINQTALKIVRRKIELIRRGDEAMTQEIGEGKDLMSVLLRQSLDADTSSEAEPLSEAGLVGQMSALLLAATDTTSATLIRIVQLLSEHPSVQRKLKEEIFQATLAVGRELNNFDYDALAGLPFLDAVIRETLRMFPAFYITHRVSDEDAVLPLSSPVRGLDGQLIHELPVPAGTIVWVNVLGLNRDPAIWGPDAAEWKPERWLSPLPGTVTDAHVPSVFANLATFSAGPRSCIGYNLALTEMRVALSHMALAFEFSPSGRSIVWKFAGVYAPSVEGSKATQPEFSVLLRSTR